jgi:ubiquinone/menaquinone biosynthesis C-methylase UbiE
MLGKQVTLFINEVDKDLVKYNAYKKSINAFGFEATAINIIQGSKKETMLPQKMNKIIIRNTFHHFSKKNKMLASIRSSMKPDGRLFILESLKNDLPATCKHTLYDYEIKSFFEKNGFVLEREKRLGDAILLEYTLKKE